MLESAIEQLLLRFLSPYVDGIAGDKLQLGVFRGSLELRDLQVKAEAPSLLGLEGFRARGGIGFIQLKIPWNKLHTGKLRVVARGLHVDLEPLAEALAGVEDPLQAQVAELRRAKRRAVELRAAQVAELGQQVSPDDGRRQDSGYLVRLLRKILNNIHIDLSDLRITFASRLQNLSLHLELPSLEVLSTDQTFRESLAEVTVSGQSLYKVLHLRDLAVLASASSRGGYVLSPTSARLQLAHVPSDQTLFLRFEVATLEAAAVVLTHSQVMHMLAAQAAAAAQAARLYRAMVSVDQEVCMAGFLRRCC
ncbi:unnamed protein product [Effrenium voratum]|nr:unnamed protein product [Effrenium voratum]